jgi:serine/threonine protein kinase
MGGRGIDDYVILKEAGKGAYGLVMRAKVKGPKGEPVGEEVIIKYIIKARILADCWKKHRELGPIPVEIHVMDQLRHLLYNPPLHPHPWDPMRARTAAGAPSNLNNGHAKRDSQESLVNTPDSPRSDSSAGGGLFSPTQRYIASEIRHSPERGHPNICKLLDFFEDREFYYRE